MLHTTQSTKSETETECLDAYIQVSSGLLVIFPAKLAAPARPLQAPQHWCPTADKQPGGGRRSRPRSAQYAVTAAPAALREPRSACRVQGVDSLRRLPKPACNQAQPATA